jgi:hypothetical protein
LEGRANAFTVEIERKFNDMFKIFTEEMKIAEEERRSRSNDMGGDIREEILKIKAEA